MQNHVAFLYVIYMYMNGLFVYYQYACHYQHNRTDCRLISNVQMN